LICYGIAKPNQTTARESSLENKDLTLLGCSGKRGKVKLYTLGNPENALITIDKQKEGSLPGDNSGF